MMHLHLGLILICASFAASLKVHVSEPLSYQYDVQVANGIPEVSETVGFLRISAIVSLKKSSNNEVILSARKIRVLQKVSQNFNFNELVPIANLSWLDNEHVYHKMKFELMKSFKVLLNSDGAIDEVFFHRDEPHWSINIKKGLLSFLQVNYTKSSKEPTDEPRNSTTSWNKVVLEDTVAGKCKTFYHVQSSRIEDDYESVSSDATMYDVIKSTDYLRCQHPISQEQQSAFSSKTLWHADDCTSSQQDANNKIDVSHITKYKMIGGPKSHILEAFSKSSHSLAPFSGSESSTARISSIQKLVKMEFTSEPTGSSQATSSTNDDEKMKFTSEPTGSSQATTSTNEYEKMKFTSEPTGSSQVTTSTNDDEKMKFTSEPTGSPQVTTSTNDDERMAFTSEATDSSETTTSNTDKWRKMPSGLNLVHYSEAHEDYGAVKTTLKKVVKRMAEKTNDVEYRKEKYSSDATLIMRLARQLTVEDLLNFVTLKNDFEMTNLKDEEKSVLREHQIDILPAVGNSNAIQVVVKLLEQPMQSDIESNITDIVKGPRTVMMLQKLASISHVDRKVLRKCLKLVNNPQFLQIYNTKKDAQVFKSFWLATGAFFNIYFVKQEGFESEIPNIWNMTPADIEVYRRKMKSENEKLKTEFVRGVNKMLQQHKLRLLGLKVAKNSGLLELLKPIHKLFKQNNSDDDSYLRSECIYALSKMVHIPQSARINVQEQPIPKYLVKKQEKLDKWEEKVEEIRTFLINVFSNYDFDSQLRIAAFRVIIQSKPRRIILQMLIHQLMSERSVHVYSYVWKYLSQIAHSQHICYKSIGSKVRSLLYMVQRNESRIDYSMYRKFAIGTKNNELVTFVEADTIFSEKSFLPRCAQVTSDLQIMGSNVQLMQIAVHMEGIEKAIEASLGPDGLIRRAYTIEELLHRSTRSLPSTDSMKTEDLRIKNRERHEKPTLHVDLSFYGYEVGFWEPHDVMKSLQQHGKLDISSICGFNETNMQITSMSDGKITIPAPAGFFAEIHASLNSFSNIIASITMPERVSRNTLGASLLLKPNLHAKFVLSTTADFNVLMSSSSSQRNINFTPNELKMSANLQVYKSSEPMSSMPLLNSIPEIQINWAVPQESSVLLSVNSSMHTRVACFLHTNDSGITMKQEVHRIQPRESSKKPTSVEMKNIFNEVFKFLGIQVDVMAQYHSDPNIDNSKSFTETCFAGSCNFTIKVANQHSLSHEKPTLVSFCFSPLKSINDSFIPPLISKIRISEEGSYSGNEMLPIVVPFSHLKEILIAKMDMYYSSSENWRTINSEMVAINQFGNRAALKMIRISSEMQLPNTISYEFMQHLDLKNLVQENRKLSIATKMSFIANASLPEVFRNHEPLRKDVLDAMSQKTILLSNIDMRVPRDLVEMVEENSLEELVNVFPLLKACQSEIKLSLHEQSGPKCFQLGMLMNELSEITAHISYEPAHISSYLNSTLETVHKFVQNVLAPFKKAVVYTSGEKLKSMSVKWSSSPVTNAIANCEITTPSAKIQYSNIKLPFKAFYWTGINPLLQEVQANLLGQGSPAICYRIDNHIQTADGVTFTIPKPLMKKINNGTCPVLLARDCSQQKKFQILMLQRKNPDGQVSDVIRIEANNEIFEFGQSLTTEREILNVTNNKQHITEINQVSEMRSIVEFNSSQKAWQKIKLIRESHESSNGKINVYRLHVFNLGLEVVLVPQKTLTTQIVLSPFYNNRLCGLCGDYNMETTKEFKAPNFHISYSMPSHFVSSFVTPLNQQCMDIHKSINESQHSNQLCKLEPQRGMIKTFTQKNIHVPATILSETSSISLVLFKHAVKRIKVSHSEKSFDFYYQNRKIAQIKLQPQVSVAVFPSSGEVHLINVTHESVEVPSAIVKVEMDSIVSPNHVELKVQLKKVDEKIDLISFNWREDKQVLYIHKSLIHGAKGMCQQMTRSIAQNTSKFVKLFTDHSAPRSLLAPSFTSTKLCKIEQDSVQPFHNKYSTMSKIFFMNHAIARHLQITHCPILLAHSVLRQHNTMLRVFLRWIQLDGQTLRMYEIRFGHKNNNFALVTFTSRGNGEDLKMTISGQDAVILRESGTILRTINNLNVKIIKFQADRISMLIPSIGFEFSLSTEGQMTLRLPRVNVNDNKGLCYVDEQSGESSAKQNFLTVLKKIMSHDLAFDLLNTEEMENCATTLNRLQSFRATLRSSNNLVCKIKRNANVNSVIPFSQLIKFNIASMVTEYVKCPFIVFIMPGVMKITTTSTRHMNSIKIVDLRRLASINLDKRFQTIEVSQNLGANSFAKVTIDNRVLQETSSMSQILQNNDDQEGLIFIDRKFPESMIVINLFPQEDATSTRFISLTLKIKSSSEKQSLNIFSSSTNVIAQATSVCQMNRSGSNQAESSPNMKQYLDFSNRKNECENLLVRENGF